MNMQRRGKKQGNEHGPQRIYFVNHTQKYKK
jgi:hypothetical protein